MILFLAFHLTGDVFSQEVQVSGRILAKRDGTGLSGAVVYYGADSASTDSLGYYKLVLPQKATSLEVSAWHPDFPPQSALLSAASGSQTLDMVLGASVQLLDQVVVTGNGYQQSRSTTGNATTLLNRSPEGTAASARLSEGLRGVPGAQVMQNSGNPAGGFSVRLRGPATIGGSSDPLYIIDGIIVNNSSPELLDLGGYTQNRLVDIQPEDIAHIEIIKGASAAAIYGSRASNGVVQIFTKSGSRGAPVFRYSASLMHNSLRKRIPFNKAPVMWADPVDITNTETIPTTRYDLQEEVFAPAWGAEHYLSARGGTAQTKYFASVSYLNNGGIVRNTSFERYSGRLNLSQQLSEHLELTVNTGYSVSESDEKPNGGMSEGYGAITGLLFADNAHAPFPDERGVYPVTSQLLPRPNPLEVVERFSFQQRTNRFLAGVGLEYVFSDKLTMMYQGGVDHSNQEGFAFIPLGNTSSFEQGYAHRVSVGTFQTNSNLTLRYAAALGDWGFTTVLGAESQYQRNSHFGLETHNLDPYVHVTESGTVSTRTDQRQAQSLRGAFLQETISFQEKLYVTLGIRMDGSSVFATGSGNQWYPKGNVAWLPSREKFWSGRLHQLVPLLKLRMAYGEAGNLTAIAPYTQNSRYVSEPINGQTGLVASGQLGNMSVGPERQKELEFGMDASILDDRFGLELTWYHQWVEDLLLSYALAPSRGYASTIGNVGSMTNTGLEVQGRVDLLKSERWDWGVTLMYSQNRNTVADIPGGMVVLSPSFATSYAINEQPLGVFYRQYYARAANGDIALEDNGFPYLARDDEGNVLQKVIGDPNPRWIGSLSSEVRYRNLSLRVFVDAVQGFDVFNWNRRLMDNPLFGGGANVARELTGELPKGYGGAEYGIFEAFVEDGSYVKMREIGLGYRLASPVRHISSIRIEVAARNLWSLDNYRAWDPEVNTTGQSNGVRGFDFAEVPIPRTLMTKLTVIF